MLVPFMELCACVFCGSVGVVPGVCEATATALSIVLERMNGA